jgi:hypothetical protein
LKKVETNEVKAKIDSPKKKSFLETRKKAIIRKIPKVQPLPTSVAPAKITSKKELCLLLIYKNKSDLLKIKKKVNAITKKNK